ncbi:hypothetical protein [Neobacillus drentensis]|uniref:hypothetical protein n=1 Tax=Neobacillus drentensis TaxID=220684 RepID=UPI001F227204|nr:hypothetical protein [Neobacillus drentensis]
MKKIKEEKQVYSLSVKFAEGKEISDEDGRITHIRLESRNTSVPMIVTGRNSEAKLKGIDGVFPFCSEKCGKKMKDIVSRELATFEAVKDIYIK